MQHKAAGSDPFPILQPDAGACAESLRTSFEDVLEHDSPLNALLLDPRAASVPAQIAASEVQVVVSTRLDGRSAASGCNLVARGVNGGTAAAHYGAHRPVSMRLARLCLMRSSCVHNWLCGDGARIWPATYNSARPLAQSCRTYLVEASTSASRHNNYMPGVNCQLHGVRLLPRWC